MKRSHFAVAACVALFASAAVAEFQLTSKAAEAKFRGTGPGGFKIEGKTADVQVKSGDKSFNVIVNLKNLTTGIALRDRHMRDKYLEVAKYPETRLEVPSASLKVPAAGASIDGELKGNLVLHGKTKEIPVKYHATCDAGNVCDATGTMNLNMNDFGVVVPTYLGVTMKPDVVIDVRFQVKR